MSDDIEEFIVNGYTVHIRQDDGGDEAGNPRDGMNIGVMLANGHRQYVLGDAPFAKDVPGYSDAETALAEFAEEGDINKFVDWAKAELGATVVLPLWLIDHSGLSMRTTKFHEDPGGWDSGIVGFIFDTAHTRTETGCALDRIQDALVQEVELYDQYLRGEVYGYVIHDDTDEEVESCWGFLGLDYAKEQATEAANNMNEPQFVVMTGGLTSGFNAYGPYTKEDATAEATHLRGQAIAMSEPPMHSYRLKHGEGPDLIVRLTQAELRQRLAAGWERAETKETS